MNVKVLVMFVVAFFAIAKTQDQDPDPDGMRLTIGKIN